VIRQIRALASQKEPRERISSQATELRSSHIQNRQFPLGCKLRHGL
jgi:hypothetical protein